MYFRRFPNRTLDKENIYHHFSNGIETNQTHINENVTFDCFFLMLRIEPDACAYLENRIKNIMINSCLSHNQYSNNLIHQNAN